jgi:hypothetical protein
MPPGRELVRKRSSLATRDLLVTPPSPGRTGARVRSPLATILLHTPLPEWRQEAPTRRPPAQVGQGGSGKEKPGRRRGSALLQKLNHPTLALRCRDHRVRQRLLRHPPIRSSKHNRTRRTMTIKPNRRARERLMVHSPSPGRHRNRTRRSRTINFYRRPKATIGKGPPRGRYARPAPHVITTWSQGR